jgi:hypothetical protein
MIKKGIRRDKKMSSTNANFYNEERPISYLPLDLDKFKSNKS